MKRCVWLPSLIVAMTLVTDVAAHPDLGPGHSDHFWCYHRGGDGCEIGWTWNKTAQPYVPVVIDPDLPAQLLHIDGTPWTRFELEQEVMFYIERFNDQAAADIPPAIYAGYIDDFLGGLPTLQDAFVGVVRLTYDPDPDLDKCDSFQRGCDDVAFGNAIFLQSTVLGCEPWEHFDYNPGDDTVQTLGGVFMHELLHAYGLDHQDICHNSNSPQPSCNTPVPWCCGSVGENACGNSEINNELKFDDADGLRQVYGPRSFEYFRRSESDDALSFSVLDEGVPPFQIPFSDHYFAGTWPDAIGLMPLVTTDEDRDAHLYWWSRNGDMFTDFGKVQVGAQLGQVGAALGFTDTDVFFTAGYMKGQTTNNTEMHPIVKRQSDPTSAEGLLQGLGNRFATPRNGHTLAFDPRGDRYVSVWRRDDNLIMMDHFSINGLGAYQGEPVALQVEIDSGGPSQGDETFVGYHAAYTPSVACGVASIEYNCILVWASSPTTRSPLAPDIIPATEGDHFRTLRYAQFRIILDPLTSELVIDFAPVHREVAYLQYGPPSVVYKGPPDAPDAFVIAWKTPGGCYFTNRKGAEITDDFLPNNFRRQCVDTASCTVGSPSSACIQVSPPMAGSGGFSDSVHIWTVGNDMFDP